MRPGSLCVWGSSPPPPRHLERSAARLTPPPSPRAEARSAGVERSPAEPHHRGPTPRANTNKGSRRRCKHRGPYQQRGFSAVQAWQQGSVFEVPKLRDAEKRKGGVLQNHRPLRSELRADASWKGETRCSLVWMGFHWLMESESPIADIICIWSISVEV